MVLNRRITGFELSGKSSYYSSYDEMRAGFEIYFRKRLFELVEGRLFYRLEDVVIDDVSTSASVPSFIKDEDLTISKVGLTLSRDTRDSILFPTEGSILSLRKEFAGGLFGGDADYGRLEIQGADSFRHSNLWSKFSQSRVAPGHWGDSTGSSDVPFFEKFFLGGPYNLRLGPRSGVESALGEPEGGNSFYASLSAPLKLLTFEISDLLRWCLRSGDFKLLPGDDLEGWHDSGGLECARLWVCL